MKSVRETELEWYRKHGKYPDRIIKDALDREYVIGDISWNRKKGNERRQEFVEGKMGVE